MQTCIIRKALISDFPVLEDLWLRSVKATHGFLTAEDIAGLAPFVHEAIPGCLVFLAETAGTGAGPAGAEESRLFPSCPPPGRPALCRGFIGMRGNKVEMLFVDPDHLGRKTGTALLDHVSRQHGTLLVDVNLDNARALGFYIRYGFSEVSRSPHDRAGRNFPLVHLKKARKPGDMEP